MAVCKFLSSKASVKGALEYITQKEKTEAKLIGGKDCVPENAAKEFDAVKRMFGKSNGRQYYHIIQSFSPNDPVDFETAHQLGMQLAEYFPGFQCVVATHKDRKHIHNHIVMNSVSFQNGRMFHQTAAELEQVKEYVNRLCIEHGFSTLPRRKRAAASGRNGRKSFAGWLSTPCSTATIKQNSFGSWAHRATR